MLFLFSYVNLIQSFNFSHLLHFLRWKNEKVDWKKSKTLRLFILAIIFFSFSSSSCFPVSLLNIFPPFLFLPLVSSPYESSCCVKVVTIEWHAFYKLRFLLSIPRWLQPCSPIFHQQNVPTVLFFLSLKHTIL